nr:UDP-N-acetylenolpyruvoylglucosamine reductase [Chromatiaceae bacterium]
GECEGGAQVSTRHANFIVNTGGASAHDILRLIERVRATVARHSGVMLRTEVHFIGGETV